MNFMRHAAAALLAVSPSAGGAGPGLAAPHLTYAFSVRVDLGAPQEQGIVDGRRLRFVPITGGKVIGPRLHGVVLPGGGDWQAIHPDGLTEVDARYTLKADDGTIIGIVNPGVRTAAPAIVERMARGEDVDPSLYYFRTAPRFTVAAGSHEWLRQTLFVGRGIRRPTFVEIEFFAVD